MSIVIGIDASRNRSGGAKAHLIGIISEGSPQIHGIHEVHVWSYRKLLDALPDKPWLIKHNPPELEGSLLRQMWWQMCCLSREAKLVNCKVLFSTDAASVCRFHPMVVMSQDMLSYEPGMMRKFGFSLARMRLLLILVIQNKAMKYSAGVIFLTNYAAKIIQHSTGSLNKTVTISHGIDEVFKGAESKRVWPSDGARAIRCLYISNAAMYKHQWVVVKAIGKLRRRGHNIELMLVGGGVGRAQSLLDQEVLLTDPEGGFIEQKGAVNHYDLPEILARADLFIFASSCENLPITLLEAMASGLPIACSDRGPMPEVLRDAGVYFNPDNAESIVVGVEELIFKSDRRESIAKKAKMLSKEYSWSKCSSETWVFLKTIAKE